MFKPNSLLLICFFSLLLAVQSTNAQWGNPHHREEGEDETGEEILAREQYYIEHRAGGPGRIVPFDAYANAVRQHLAMPRDEDFLVNPSTAVSWQTRNPVGMFYARTNNNYIAGRTNFMVFHPTDPDKFYCAAAGGGIWKTTDGGSLWVPLTDFLTSLASGGLALDPNNPSVLYYGTGELNFSGDSWYGDGIYKTTDEGDTWTKVATTAVGQRFSQLVVDPINSNIVYAAGSLGVFKSTNAGGTWNSTSTGNNANCLIMDPTDTQVLYTSVGGSGTNTIRKSTNGGGSWTTLTGGLPTDGRRSQLAMAPSNNQILYASVANTSGGLRGLYRTTDGGENWTLQASSPNYLGSQGWYDNSVCVHPTNPDFVVAGGIDIYSSSNSGVTLTQRTSWSTTSSSNMSHADIHFLQYNGSVLYCGSDGGVYKSTNNAVTWTDLNATMSTLQYQSADYDPTDPQKLYGGTQDNNLETSTNGGLVWIQRTTGDGGYSIVDPVTPNYVYGQYVQGSLKRSSNYGVSFTEIAPNGSTGGLFYNPYEMAPSDNNTIVYCEGDVWKTTSVKTATTSSGWTQLATNAIVGGSVSAIGISHTNPDKIFIGTSNGRIHVTTNNGANWTTTTGFAKVSDFAVDPVNDNICYATFTGFTSTMHVYKTTNGGTSWFSVTGNLPNIPTSTIVLRANPPRTLFVGTDLGVYKSTDDGISWVVFSNGLPTATIYDLKYKEGNQLLLAATHGRGCWMFDYGAYLITSVPEANIPKEFALHQNYPNPFNPTTTFRFDIPKTSHVILNVFNVMGQEVATVVNGVREAGEHRETWNAVGLASGVYYFRMAAESYVQSGKLVLLK
ncbi:MAG: T9SS type A sorting domain-containing protein [Bacteroidetes bacterium]|nr:T9SS type A sorting domain-containing protein [Bacteroidota bacterium]MCW5894315.1 T9SS type A sorting domain-containing protein [Bacteroidota bacterium]